MQDVSSFLTEMRDVYKKTLGRTPPDISPDAYAAFPPGVDPVSFAIDEVKQLQQLVHRSPIWPQAVGWVPQMNTYTKDDAFIVEMDLAGLVRDDLGVFVRGTECVVRGERKPGKQASDAHPLTTERTWGFFERSFSLPVNAKPDEITAKYTDGLLELKIPFDKEGKPLEKEVAIS